MLLPGFFRRGWSDPFYKTAPSDLDCEIYQSDPEKDVKKYKEGVTARSKAIHKARQEEKLKIPFTCALCGKTFYLKSVNHKESDICYECKDLRWCKKFNLYCLKLDTSECKACKHYYL